MLDKQCEELVFPVLFPKADMSAHQDDKLQFHQWSTLMLDSNIIVEGLPQTLEYLFAQFIIEQKKVSDSINIALKKVNLSLLLN